MKQITEPRSARLLWVNEEKRILSFHEETGFRPFPFPSREAMISYVLEHARDGFRIQ